MDAQDAAVLDAGADPLAGAVRALAIKRVLRAGGAVKRARSAMADDILSFNALAQTNDELKFARTVAAAANVPLVSIKPGDDPALLISATDDAMVHALDDAAAEYAETLVAETLVREERETQSRIARAMREVGKELTAYHEVVVEEGSGPPIDIEFTEAHYSALAAAKNICAIARASIGGWGTVDDVGEDPILSESIRAFDRGVRNRVFQPIEKAENEGIGQATQRVLSVLYNTVAGDGISGVRRPWGTFSPKVIDELFAAVEERLESTVAEYARQRRIVQTKRDADYDVVELYEEVSAAGFVDGDFADAIAGAARGAAEGALAARGAEGGNTERMVMAKTRYETALAHAEGVVERLGTEPIIERIQGRALAAANQAMAMLMPEDRAKIGHKDLWPSFTTLLNAALTMMAASSRKPGGWMRQLQEYANLIAMAQTVIHNHPGVP